MKKYISKKLKEKIKVVVSKNRHLFLKYKNKKKIFVCLGADYGNLGDVAITTSQIKFLKELFDDYIILEFPISITYTDFKSLKEVVNKNDIITFVGGGNSSSRYSDIEYCRQFIIKRFPKNKIITFPQSVVLDKDNSKFNKLFKKCYLSHKKLLYFVREKYSYNLLKKEIPYLNLNLAPDIVMSYKTFTNYNRNGIIISLRNDKEKNLNNDNKTKLENIIKENSNEIIEYFDTQLSIDYTLSDKQRRVEFDKLLDKYSKSRLVITDRLHGMIIAYITNTPCIVFSCDNTKIKGCYEWLKKSKKTIYREQFNPEVFKIDLLDLINNTYSNNEEICFDNMKGVIKEFVYEDD